MQAVAKTWSGFQYGQQFEVKVRRMRVKYDKWKQMKLPAFQRPEEQIVDIPRQGAEQYCLTHPLLGQLHSDSQLFHHCSQIKFNIERRDLPFKKKFATVEVDPRVYREIMSS